MDGYLLSNIAAYSAQVALLVALATTLAWLLRIEAAPVRYGYWRAVFALCLLLPLLQGRHVPALDPAAALPSFEIQTTLNDVGRPVMSSSSLPWRAVVLGAIAAGAGVRVLWLAINLLRLRRLRRSGAPAAETSMRSELCAMIGCAPEIRYVARLRQPVTFGLVRPVVLLPASLAAHSEEIQRAVLSHELFHVKRRDWGWLLFEEMVAAVLWFNPAIWWLMSRLHLAREVVVDELAVLATGRRRTYVAALMAFADETSLAPVAAFGGRAQLFDRIVLLSKEAGMSSRRLVFTVAVVVAGLAAGTWRVVQAFPLTAPLASLQQTGPGPLERQAKPVTPENPIPRRTNFEAAFYPGEARAAGARGSVTVMITVDTLGRVAEARRVRLQLTSTNPSASLEFNNTTPIQDLRFTVNRSDEQSGLLRSVATAMEASALRAVQQWRYEPPADGPIAFPVQIYLSDASDPSPAAAAPPVASASPGHVQKAAPIRVGGNIKPPTKIKDVRPVYPDEALAANVSGPVILELRVGGDGAVEEARVLRSIPLLDQAAIDAASQWRFTPTLLNGQPVPVVLTVTINFTQQPPTRTQAAAPSGPPTHVPAVIKEVKPVYSREMLDAGAEGWVEVEATVTDGKVSDARVIRGAPMLDEAALDAARQWEFARLPAPATVKIEFSFKTRKNR